MSKTIQEFALEMSDVQTISVPAGSVALGVTCQPAPLPAAVVLVVMADPYERERRDWRIWIVGTGMPVPTAVEAEYVYGSPYLGTVWRLGCALHVFGARLPAAGGPPSPPESGSAGAGKDGAR